MKKRIALVLGLVTLVILAIVAIFWTVNQNLEGKTEFPTIVITDDGELYVPTEHLLILKDSSNNVFFAYYKKPTDRQIYDIVSNSILPLGFCSTVELALKDSSTTIRDSKTTIFVPTMLPQLMEKITKFEDGNLYIKASELESVRNLL